MRDRTVSPTPWMLGGQPVYLACDAQIAPNLHPSFGGQQGLVQQALDAWDMELPSAIQSIVVPSANLIPMTVAISRRRDRGMIAWGVHVGHTGPKVGLSPFKPFTGRHDMDAILTDLITIEFNPEAQCLIVTRCYPGTYAPPLPWEPEAAYAQDGVEGCIRYWRVNAYVVTPATRVMRYQSDDAPPPWWR